MLGAERKVSLALGQGRTEVKSFMHVTVVYFLEC